MKGLLKAALAGAAMLLLTFGSASSGYAHGAKFIFVSHGQSNDPFHSIIKRGAVQAAKDHGDELDYRTPLTFDMVRMAQLIDAAANQKPDGLIVTIPDADALGPAIHRAVEAGIPVIAVNSGYEHGGALIKKLGVLLYIGQDEHLAGVEAGERLKALGGKKAICINPEVGNVTLDVRCEGFKEGFGGSMEVLPTRIDPSDIEAKLRAKLMSDPTIDTVLAESAPFGGEEAVKIVGELGLESKVHVATFDLSVGVLKALDEGKIAFCIDQQPYLYGYLAVTVLALYHDDGVIPVSNILTGPRFLTKGMGAQVLALSAKGTR
jgi:simple sugar transport system substrate-binding protein